ncbi:MAG: hypothetical protein OEQ74_01050, partial [Gammaproteobacteria bacterium]|nr:hypothetical protein [Gammaproteobacteria bacterium]
TSLTCDDNPGVEVTQVTLGLGDSITCTFVNDDNAPGLTLVKTVINDNSGTSVTTDFTLSAAGPTPISGPGGATSDATFAAGTYTLSEAGPGGYTAGDWVCTGGMQAGDQVTVALGESATCTITNDDIPNPAIDIEKATNGVDADNADNDDIPIIVPGDLVTWTYLVTNTGDEPIALADLIVSDSVTGVTPMFDPSSDVGDDEILSPGETWTYTATGFALDLTVAPPMGTTFVPGCKDVSRSLGTNAYENIGTAVAPGASDSDPSHYCNPPDGTLTLIKNVINDNGGTAGPNDFGLTMDNIAVPSGTLVIWPGGTEVVIDEVQQAGYGFVDISGDANCPDLPGGTVRIVPGKDITCTITNDDQPSGSDTDSDGVPDSVDNCTNLANPLQIDTDADGHGNRCDADFDQNCVVNFDDVGIFKTGFLTVDPLLDLDSDGGATDFQDLAIVKDLFLLAPGPSAGPALCNP